MAKLKIPPDQIEDVMQEVWLDALRSGATFIGEHAEQQRFAWLDRVVRRKAVDVLRRLQRQPAESLDALAVEPVDRETTEPAERMGTKEREELLAARLAELRAEDPENGLLLCERFLEERTIQDLAAETDLGSNAIHCRIGRILKKLRGRL